MKKTVFIILIFSLLFIPALQGAAQQTQNQSNEFDNLKLPVWAKDLRRIDIITFGSFPFSMFFVTFATDMVRWYNENNFDFTEQGRRYAPWPLKSAGAVDMTSVEQVRTIFIAAGVSVVIALVDLMIVKIKQNNERKRIESRPTGSIEIERRQISASEDENETEAGRDLPHINSGLE